MDASLGEKRFSLAPNSLRKTDPTADYEQVGGITPEQMAILQESVKKQHARDHSSSEDSDASSKGSRKDQQNNQHNKPTPDKDQHNKAPPAKKSVTINQEMAKGHDGDATNGGVLDLDNIHAAAPPQRSLRMSVKGAPERLFTTDFNAAMADPEPEVEEKVSLKTSVKGKTRKSLRGSVKG